MAGATSELLDEKIFDIVGHLNAGRALVDTDLEKVDLAELNLKAGKKAKLSTAYESALQYFSIGIELLGKTPGRTNMT